MSRKRRRTPTSCIGPLSTAIRPAAGGQSPEVALGTDDDENRVAGIATIDGVEPVARRAQRWFARLGRPIDDVPGSKSTGLDSPNVDGFVSRRSQVRSACPEVAGRLTVTNPCAFQERRAPPATNHQIDAAVLRGTRPFKKVPRKTLDQHLPERPHQDQSPVVSGYGAAEADIRTAAAALRSLGAAASKSEQEFGASGVP